MLFLYDLIEELCIKKGVTVTKLCRDCNISRSKLTDYKKGRIKTLSLDTICKIADYFDVSVEYLTGAPTSVSNEEKLKALLFGEGTVVTDEMWNEVKNFAATLKEKYEK